MDADTGLAARRGDQPVAGQHLSRSRWMRLMAERGYRDGAVCGRLRHPVPEPRRGRRRARGGPRLGERRTASRCILTKTQDRRLPAAGERVRVPRLPVRSRPASRAQEEPRQAQGDDPREDAAHPRAQPRVRRSPISTGRCAAGSATSSTPTHASSASSTRLSGDGCAPILRKQEKRPGFGTLPRRPSTLAKCLLRACRAVRTSHGLAIRETVSMKKPPTGEPYAGKPPVRFGGRGRRKPIPTPISKSLTFSEVHRDFSRCEPPSTRRVKSRWTSLRA